MPDKKLTDNEIKKALECCINEDGDLFACGNQGCVFMECKRGKDRECHYYMMKAVLDLINRLQRENEKNENIIRLADKTIETANAEIERLQNKVEELSEVLSDTIRIRYAEAKAEAVKEFAERLCEGRVSNDPVVIAVKVELEMVGKQRKEDEGK